MPTPYPTLTPCKYNNIFCYHAKREDNQIMCARLIRFGCVRDHFTATCQYCGNKVSETAGTRVLYCPKCGEKTRIGKPHP